MPKFSIKTENGQLYTVEAESSTSAIMDMMSIDGERVTEIHPLPDDPDEQERLALDIEPGTL